MAMRKYRFVEEFVRGKESMGDEIASPKMVVTKNFGARLLHQIAECEYIEKTDAKGEKVVSEKMGKRGGWIEKYGNLSQKGGCWIEEGGIVCGDAFVSGDAIIRGNAEIGDNAKVGGYAEVSESVLVRDNAVVKGFATLSGTTAVSGSAYVESAWIKGGTITDDARIVCPIGISDEEAVEEFKILSEVEKRKKTIEIADSQVSGKSYVYGYNIYIAGGATIAGNVVVGIQSYIKGGVHLSGISTISRSVLAGSVSVCDVTVEDGCIGEAKEMSKAWDERQTRWGWKGEKPLCVSLAERYSR